VYVHHEEAVTISMYDDHAASTRSNELEYVYLCEECAGESDGDVTHLSTTVPGEPGACDDCGSPNRVEESY
jgi:hypothetical protein